MLMDLFSQFLRDYGRDTPLLTDVGIQKTFPSTASFRLVAHFSDGQHVSAQVHADGLSEYSRRHSAWDLGSIRSPLMREGRAIYAQMVEAHEIEIYMREQCLNETRQLPSEMFQHNARFGEHHWSRRPWAIDLFDSSPSFTNREAHDRGMRLLVENLSPDQRAQYETSGHFDVTGGETGKRYRITKAYQMNVLEIGNNGKRARSLCFMPKGNFVLGDVMLAQKLALELFESHALAVANAITGPASPIFPMG
jgi:hypothetical protein